MDRESHDMRCKNSKACVDFPRKRLGKEYRVKLS